MRDPAESTMFVNNQPERITDLRTILAQAHGHRCFLLHPRDGFSTAYLWITEVVEPLDQIERCGEQAGSACVEEISPVRREVTTIDRTVGRGTAEHETSRIVAKRRLGHVQRPEDSLLREIGKGL